MGDKEVELTQTEKQKTKKSKCCLRDLWDNIKKNSIYI